MMKMNKLFGSIWSVLFVCFGFVADANAGLVITDDQLYRDRADNYSYVGWVSGVDPDSTVRYGSGVLINPNWVLTAAHVVANSSTLNLRDSVQFGLGSNLLTNRGETMSASDLYLHPTYGGGDTGYDLALVYFDNPFVSATPVTLFAGDLVAGMDSDIVGYGVYQEVDSNIQSVTGDRRAGNNLIGEVGYPGDQFAISYLRSPTSSKFRPLGMAATSGDSGGGLFIDGELAGITKSASLFNSYGTITTYNLLDRDWINTTIASRSSSVPEPSTFILLLVASPIFML